MTNEASGARLTPERRRDQIVAVAARHFSRDGVASASVSAIARESGVTRALVYHYFPGKGALLEAVLRREADRLLAATAPDPERSPRVNLERALAAFFDHFAASSGGVRELYAPSAATAPAVADLAAANHSVQVERVIRVSGSHDTAETRVAVGAWLAFVEHVARTAGDDPTLSRPHLTDLCRRALETAIGHPLPTS
jgi:AcrR family transcriptional regulator